MTDYIRRHPLLSAALGFVILAPSLGLLFGLLLRGRLDAEHGGEDEPPPAGAVTADAPGGRSLMRIAWACLAGALLLLSFYLPMIPLPGVPEAVRVEGYPFVNKNIVELVALLTLATTASGKWAGLDSLFRFLKRKNYRKKDQSFSRSVAQSISPSVGSPTS